MNENFNNDKKGLETTPGPTKEDNNIGSEQVFNQNGENDRKEGDSHDLSQPNEKLGNKPAYGHNQDENLTDNQKYSQYPSYPNLNKNNYEKKRLDKGLKMFLVAAACIFFLLLLLLGGYLAYNFGKNSDNLNLNSGSNNPSISENGVINSNAPTLTIENQPSDTGELSAETIYSKTSASVVGIVVYDTSADIVSSSVSQGSGIITSSDGYIVTNSHVIGDSKKYNVKVVFFDGTEYAAKIVGYDTRTDLAVLKIDAKDLSPATFGNSDELHVGAWVIAIGNPGGLDFANSLTRGTISALNRTVGSAQSLVKHIQTDAAINPGNSGGALLNMYGQVIGINTSKIASVDYEGMGFAIPSNTAKKVIDDIIAKGYVSGRVRLGITGKVIGNYQAQLYDVPCGILISSISGDSSLSSNGIKEGDIITKINGINVTGFDTLYSELTNYKPGDTVTLTIFRYSKNSISSTFESKVTLLEDKGETQNEFKNPNQ